MKYKVGDKVRIRSDLDINKQYGAVTLLDGSMGANIGKASTIIDVSRHNGVYFLDNGYYF